MPELTKEEKLKIFEKLPKELKDLMESDNTGAILLYVGEKYNLDNDKISLLSKIVGDVILGLLPLPNLASEIINNKIVLDQNIAFQITQEVNNELFAPVEHLFKSAPISATAPSPAPTLKPTASPAPRPSYDQYREPPEIIDLRKTPPPPMPAPVAAAPIPPMASKIEPPKPPLTFTKPLIEIEADPHKTEAPSALSTDEYREPIIIRPPGMPPVNNSDRILDLRRDKGEF